MLREPFPANQIGKLPKIMKRDDQDKGKCERGSRYSADGHYCGGWHARAIHLDFVGHAALTDRLLDADPLWSWEPVAFDQNGLPALDGNGGLWLRLTVCGVTRLGYGDAGGKRGGDAIKEAIGDGLRNAGMRFGAALDLWHKGDLHADANEAASMPEDRADTGSEGTAGEASTIVADLMAVTKELGLDAKDVAVAFASWHAKHLTVAQAAKDDPDSVRGFTERLANSEITVGAP